MNDTREEPTLTHMIDVLTRVRVIMDTQLDDNGERFRDGNAELYDEVLALEGFARDCAMTAGEMILRREAQ
jgi:hypothetical protein